MGKVSSDTNIYRGYADEIAELEKLSNAMESVLSDISEKLGKTSDYMGSATQYKTSIKAMSIQVKLLNELYGVISKKMYETANKFEEADEKNAQGTAKGLK